MFNFLRNNLKRFGLVYKIHCRLSCLLTVLRYSYWCLKYKSNNIIFSRKIRVRLQSSGIIINRKPNVYFASTSFDQDSMGIIPELKKIALVTIFCNNGKYEFDFPTSNEALSVRQSNSDRLMDHFKKTIESIPLDYFVFQGWGYLVDPVCISKIREMGVKVVNIAMDDRHSFHLNKFRDLDDCGTLSLANYIDLTVTCAPEAVSWYKAHNNNAIYLPEASSDSVFAFSSNQHIIKDIDVLFIGKNYGPRARIINCIKQSNSCNVVCYGSGWPEGKIDSNFIPSLYARSKIVLGIGGILHCESFPALKMRDFDVPMSGAFYLPQFNPDLYDVYDHHVLDKIMWRTSKELVDKISYFIANKDDRESIALSMHHTALRDHNWRSRFSLIFSKLQSLH